MLTVVTLGHKIQRQLDREVSHAGRQHASDGITSLDGDRQRRWRQFLQTARKGVGQPAACWRTAEGQPCQKGEGIVWVL